MPVTVYPHTENYSTGIADPGYPKPAEGVSIDFLLQLADSNLLLCQRNAEWCGHGPILEQDIAITNIALDLLGQARNFYQYAALRMNEMAGQSAASNAVAGPEIFTEDSLAYLRTEREFKNHLLTELPNGDWGQTILRQFLYSSFQLVLYGQLKISADSPLAAIAEKSIKEVAYHVKWSGEWVVRLGDGTTESRQRLLSAIENLWPYTGELFIPAVYEKPENIGADLRSLHQAWLEKIDAVFEAATLGRPALDLDSATQGFMQTGGKTGLHTEHLGYMLAEMQYLQRTYPGAQW